jgi:hypothetical protein
MRIRSGCQVGIGSRFENYSRWIGYDVVRLRETRGLEIWIVRTLGLDLVYVGNEYLA